MSNLSEVSIYSREPYKHNADSTWLFSFFARKSGKSVDQSEQTFIFQNKNKRPRCIKVGNGPLKSLCEKYCNYLLTTTQSDRFASCEHFVSLSQTSSTPPWNKPILDIPKSERSIVYLIRKWPMDSKFKIIIYCLSWWTPHLRPHSGNDFLSFFFNNLFLLLPVSDCCGTGCFGK